jgi:hypothetical protein
LLVLNPNYINTYYFDISTAKFYLSVTNNFAVTHVFNVFDKAFFVLEF